MTIRAAIYARYSGPKQPGPPIDDQVRLCREIERRGAGVVAVFADAAIAGSLAHRAPARGQKLMAAVRRGEFDMVIADSLDHLPRDLEDTAGIQSTSARRTPASAG
jgi:site-specific DNA recombinase